MRTLDWLVVLVPTLCIFAIAWKTRTYCKSVSNFLSGGRVAGRYVVAVAGGEAALGLIAVVALFEQYYRSGFAIGFWQKLASPIWLLLALTGFLIYRYRETRALTLAQFFELRYSKRFRVFAGALAFIAGVINYSLFPAVGARFFIIYAGLPLEIQIGSLTLPTFPLVVFGFLGLAVLFVVVGGQLTVMVTDCVQGIFSYSAYAILVVAVLCIFQFDQFRETMLSRGPGESFINPFDTGKLEDFNMLYIFIGIVATVYNRLSWQGAMGYNSAAINAHEQKLAGVLSSWRSGFSGLMIILLAVAGYTFLNHPDFAGQAREVHMELEQRIHAESEVSERTLQNQMLVPVAIREYLPVGLVGLFLAVMMFLMLSTDTTCLHSWGSILVQDVILPFRKKPFEPHTQLLLLRVSVIAVALFAAIFSILYNQTTYIFMFMALTGAVYLGGAGAVIIGGLYWKRGTVWGAWAAMISGCILAGAGFLCTQYWASGIYPYLAARSPDLLVSWAAVLESMSEAIPIASWSLTPEKFPISGQEILFLTMLTSVTVYVGVSLLTCRKPFDLDRMLHRGIYALSGENTGAPTVSEESNRSLLEKMTGITDNYSVGDRVIAWSVFWWLTGNFAFFLFVVAWNLFVGVWSPETWFLYWKYYVIGLTIAVAAITTIWFTIGGTVDLLRMFRRLETFVVNSEDDGRVVDGTNTGEADMRTSDAKARKQG